MVSGFSMRMTGLLDHCVMAHTSPGCDTTSHQPTNGCAPPCFPPTAAVDAELEDLTVLPVGLLLPPPEAPAAVVARHVMGKMFLTVSMSGEMEPTKDLPEKNNNHHIKT